MDYQAFFEQSSALMIVLDTKLNIVSASDAFLKASKTSREKIIGVHLFDVFPDNTEEINSHRGNSIRASFNRVLKTKAPDILAVVKYDIPNPNGGGFIQKYWKTTHSPVFDSFNEVQFIIQVAEDVTENEILIDQLEQDRKALKVIEDSDKRYNLLLMKSPFGFAVFKGENMVISIANDSMKDFWGKGNDVEGKPLFELIPELKDSDFPNLLYEVYTTGNPFYGDELLAPIIRNGKLEDAYFNFIYQPYLEADETISGVTIIAYEVTSQALLKKALEEQLAAKEKAIKKIEESDKRYNLMLMHSPFTFAVLKGKDLVIDLANKRVKEVWGKGNDIEGKSLFEIMPELYNTPFPALIDEVIATGIPYHGREVQSSANLHGQTREEYFNFVFQPYMEADQTVSGVTIIGNDVTEQVITKRKIEESEAHFRQMADLMPAKISNADVDGNVLYFNKHWLEYTGLDFEELKNFGYHNILHPDELEEFKERFKKASETKTNLEMEMRFLDKNGDYKWHLNLVSPILNENQEIKMWVGSTTEIQHQKEQTDLLKQAVKERTKDLERVNAALIYQNEEKEKRAEELFIANKELAYQNEEKEKWASELIIANYARSLIEASLDPLVTISASGKILDVNEASVKVTGVPREKLIDTDFSNYFTEPTKAQEGYLQVFEKGFVADYPLTIKHKNGTLTDVLYNASVYKDDTGNVLGVFAAARDVTEQKWVKDLRIANKELVFQNEEKEKRAKELNIANKELAYQSEEKEKRASDLVNLSRDLKAQQQELKKANELLVKQDEKVSTINHELSLLNLELEKRVISRTKALEESEIRFRNMMETIPQISWTNTLDGKFTFYNQRWYDYTGLNKKQTQEFGPKSIIHPDDLKTARNKYYSILKNGNGGEFQTRGKREDGIYRWHLIRLMPIKTDDENELQLWVGTATDIEELRVLQQQKDDFISIASHELKTPITALKASLQIMNKMKDNPSSALFSNLIGRASISLDKVSSLVENLLNTSKANEGQIHLNQKRFVISKVVEDCCYHVRDEGTYAIKTIGDLELEVFADAMQIDQVIINLVNNAIKYAPKSKEVIVKIERLVNSAKISISDQGPGIEPEKQRHLFDRYYRVDSSGSQYSGLGLGLYISAEIIKRHKGQIGVDSELGKGSTFWFTLPI